MEGPAAVLWHAAFPDAPLCATLEEALHGAASLVSGTGWASRLEHDARVVARSNGIHVAAVLDHWVNYAQRFEREGHVEWPDELWVADEYARHIAQSTFPTISTRKFDNLYLESQLARVKSAPGEGAVLYILEPVRQNWGGIDGEFQALDYALSHVEALCHGNVQRIMLRLHPSEHPEKYQAYLANDLRVHMDTSVDMAEAISRADVVIGVESFALTIALAAGRPVYSSLPPWAPPLRLPHTGIQQIRHLRS
jgi:hypothetical protein